MATSAAELLHLEVARDLMDLRYEHGLSEPDLDAVKAAARRWTSEYSKVAAMKLIESNLLQPGVTIEELSAAL